MEAFLLGEFVLVGQVLDVFDEVFRRRARSIATYYLSILIDEEEAGNADDAEQILQRLLLLPAADELLPCRLILIQFLHPRIAIAIERDAYKLYAAVILVVFHEFFHERNLHAARSAPCSPYG